jgi:hypothetical protein
VWPKVCACGSTYSARGWSSLELVGEHDDGVDLLELRNCVCGSTLAVAIAPARSAR